MSKSIRKFFILAGIISPLLLFIFITLYSVLWSGYNYLGEYVSVLGSDGSPLQILFNIAGFGLFGIIIVGFALTLNSSLKSGYFSKIANQLLMASGLLVATLSVFPTDRGYDNLAFHGRLHSIFGSLAFVMFPLSVLWHALAFRQDENWGLVWWNISLILAAIGLGCAAILAESPASAFGGSIERLGIGANLLWMFLVAFNLLFQDLYEKLKV